jgi:N-acetylglutamate synthase/N-acetylornithine aminotransferase
VRGGGFAAIFQNQVFIVHQRRVNFRQTAPRGRSLDKIERIEQAIGATADEVLVLSTGIIGEFLPLEKIRAGIAAAAPYC